MLILFRGVACVKSLNYLINSSYSLGNLRIPGRPVQMAPRATVHLLNCSLSFLSVVFSCSYSTSRGLRLYFILHRMKIKLNMLIERHATVRRSSSLAWRSRRFLLSLAVMYWYHTVPVPVLYVARCSTLHQHTVPESTLYISSPIQVTYANDVSIYWRLRHTSSVTLSYTNSR